MQEGQSWQSLSVLKVLKKFTTQGTFKFYTADIATISTTMAYLKLRMCRARGETNTVVEKQDIVPYSVTNET